MVTKCLGIIRKDADGHGEPQSEERVFCPLIEPGT